MAINGSTVASFSALDQNLVVSDGLTGEILHAKTGLDHDDGLIIEGISRVNNPANPLVLLTMNQATKKYQLEALDSNYHGTTTY